METSTSPLILYLDVDNTLFTPGESPRPRPQVVEFLNALYDEKIPIRLYSNNYQRSSHSLINAYLRENNCKIELPFSLQDRQLPFAIDKLKEWRRKNPEYGVLRIQGEAFIEKELSDCLIDEKELRKAILVDDDNGCWLRNFGRFIPAVKFDENQMLPGIDVPDPLHAMDTQVLFVTVQ
jgi:hypothetical protein